MEEREYERNGLPAIETVVIQPTPFCNISCTYCYLPQRDVKSVIDHSVIATLFAEIFASGWATPELTVIWHAGEPLVLPVSFYQTAFETVASLTPPSVVVRHSFQTNGMLITPEWCDFFKEWQVGIGVSIDGPQRLHDAYRVTRAGGGTFARTVSGIRLLRKNNVPFHVISVLSLDSMDAAKEILDFYLSEGIEDVCFNVEESEGSHVSGLFEAGDAKARFTSFLDTFWNLSRQAPGIRFIREVDGMLTRIFRPEGTVITNAQVRPFGMLNVDCRGNVSTFSPELLGLKSPKYNDFIVGTVGKDSLSEMLRAPAMEEMAHDIGTGVAACRQSCDYFSVCGGGAPVNKLAETGSFHSTDTAFCRLTQMVPVDIILDAFSRLERDGSVVR